MTVDPSLLSELENDAKPTVVNEDKLTTLRKLAQKATDLTVEIELLEEEVKSKSKELADITERQMVEIFDELKLGDLTTDSGWKFKVQNEVKGSLPKDPVKKRAALDEIKKLNGEGIIKNEVVVDIPKGDEASQIVSTLLQKAAELGVPAVNEQNVHPQTLLAFVRNCLKDGEDIDPEKVGVYLLRRTKVTSPK